jgi:hypothetical protein
VPARTFERGHQAGRCDRDRPAGSLLLTLTRRLPLTDREATNISVDGDIDLVQHWLDNTAHVSG